MKDPSRRKAAGAKTAAAKGVFQRILASVLAGVLLVVCGCAQQKEALPTEPCQILFKAKVPITLHERKIIVQGNLNGQPVRMMLDTGSEISVIEPNTAESLGGVYNRERLFQFGGVNGRLDAQHPYKLKTIQIGPLHWFDFEIAVARVARAEKQNAPDAVAGIIGNDLLKWYDVELDFQRGEMTFYQTPKCKGDFVPWEKPYEVMRSPLNRRKFFIVPVELNGRTLRALVDTGAGNTRVDLTAVVAAGADKAVLQQSRKIVATGIGGLEMPARLYRFDSLTVAGKKLKNPTLSVGEASLPDGIDMLLGMDFWWQYKMWLSHQTGQVFMQQISLPALREPAATPANANHQQLQFQEEQREALKKK